MGPLLKVASSHTTRLVGMVLALALAVTLVCGTFVLTDTIDSASRSDSVVAGESPGRVTVGGSAMGGVPEEGTRPDLVPARMAVALGVRAVWPAVAGYAALASAFGAVSSKGLAAGMDAVRPERQQVVTGAQIAREARQSWGTALGFVPTAMSVLAAVAVLVGAFFVFNTFSIVVAQRRQELGLLRALGASRAQLTASVLGEAAAAGLVASVVGTALGLAAARGLLAVCGATGYDLPSLGIVLRPRTAVAGVVSGLSVAVVAAVVPVRRATRLPAMGEINGLDDRDGSVGRAGWGGAAVLVGCGSVLVAVWGGGRHPVAAIVAGAAAILAGLAVLAPLVGRLGARLLGAPLVRWLGEPTALGRQNAMRDARRTARTAAALMIGVALAGVVAVVSASMKHSAGASLDRRLRADFVVAASTRPGGVPVAVAERLRQSPKVAVVSEVRAGGWWLGGNQQTVLAVDPGTVTRMHAVDRGSEVALGRLHDTGVLVRDTVAARHGWRVGDELPMTFARTGTRPFRIASTFSTSQVQTDYVISLPAFEANFARQLDVEVDLLMAPGTTPGDARAEIGRALDGFAGAKVMDRSEALANARAQVDRFIVPVGALLAFSVLIALLGIANTLFLSVHERLRELSVLRAIGMARSQVRSMIRTEALIVAALGSTLGAGLAVFLGWALVATMGEVGVSHLVVPAGQLVGLVTAASLAGVAAGTWPARRAARLALP